MRRVSSTYCLSIILLAGPWLASGSTFNSPAVYLPGSNTEAFVVADFNGDGKPDLAVIAFNHDYIGILLNNGDGTFRQAAQYASTYPFDIAEGDFNGDGKMDLVLTDVDGLWLLTGNGDGTFEKINIAPFPSNNSPGGDIVVADFNGDGKPDVLVGFDEYGSR